MISGIAAKLILIFLFIDIMVGDSQYFSNKTIVSILEERFSKQRNEYELLGHNFYQHKSEMIFQVEVLVNLKNINDAILFSFESINTLTNISENDFTHAILILHFENDLAPIIAKADLSCSKKYLLKSKENEYQWRKHCLSIQTQ